MNSQGYLPNYYAVEDLFVTQEKVECKVMAKLLKMGFLDPGADTEDLNPGSSISLPLWYINELKVNNPFFSVNIPDVFKNIHNAVCDAESTQIELGILHPHFYEFGRYLTPHDRNHVVGKIVFETMRQRVKYLLDISKIPNESGKPEHSLDDIENKLYYAGVKTANLYANWLQMKSNNMAASEMVQEHTKKRKRERAIVAKDNSPEQDRKRLTL